MKYFLLLLGLCLLACKKTGQQDPAVKRTALKEQTISKEQPNLEGLQVLDFDGLEPYLNKMDDELHVVNFWATWCAPCVKELPYFEALNDGIEGKSIDVLLVSLDFPDKYESKLLPFIEKYQLRSEVIALDDINQNRWIPAIDDTWSGALPATLIYKGDKRKFYEGSFTQEELETEIKQFLN